MGESVLVKGRNAETARAVLAAAERAGFPPEVVRTSSQGGYLVPKEVADQLGEAPVATEFVSAPLQTRLHGLGADETGLDLPQTSPNRLEVVERSTTANTAGPLQTGSGLAYDDAGVQRGEPLTRAAQEATGLLPGDRTEPANSWDVMVDANEQNDPAKRGAAQEEAAGQDPRELEPRQVAAQDTGRVAGTEDLPEGVAPTRETAGTGDPDATADAADKAADDKPAKASRGGRAREGEKG
jgi:hypothetical protein